MKKIQATGHKESRYGTVGTGWRCGGSRLGGECKQGPDHKGRCPYAGPPIQERSACQPGSKAGKHICGRSESAGGPCSDGPTNAGKCGIVLPPCTPQKSYRRTRLSINGWVFAILLSLVAIFLTGDSASLFIEPGERSTQHRFKDGCTVCHDQAGGQLTDWFENGFQAMIGIHEKHAEETYSCTDCHDAGKTPFSPHDQDQASLDAIYVHLFGQDMAAPAAKPQKNILCHQCHSEHQGADGNKAELSDRQCQNCHAASHDGFDDSHPQFTMFPSISAQRPLYDHDKHFKRFKKDKHAKDAPKNCESCHLFDLGAEVEFPTFDDSCSACHLEKGILDKGGKQAGGNSWLALPRIDAKTLNIGYWPNCNTLGLKKVKELPPLMVRMLSGDEETAAAIELLRTEKTKLGKLAKASDAEKLAVETLAWSIKRLFAEMQEDEPSKVMLARLETAFSTGNDRSPVLIDGNPINNDVVRAAVISWFPDLSSEIARHQANEAVAGQCASKDQWKSLKQLWGKKKVDNASGWYLQINSKTMEIGYKARAHKDGLLQSISNLSLRDTNLAKMLKEKKTTIGCQKCHQATDDNSSIVWQQPGLRLSTRFRHQPHLTVGETCESCHVLLEKEDKDEGTSSNFQTLEKSACQKCHNADGMVDSCSDCHKYHLHGVTGLISTTDFRQPESPAESESK